LKGAHSPDKIFEVNLISENNSKKTNTFRLRGVADAYESFDRPEPDNSRILERTNALEAALVSPFFLAVAVDSKDQDRPLLRYVKLSVPSRKGLPPDPKKKAKLAAIQL